MVTTITGTTNKPVSSDRLKNYFSDHDEFDGILYIGYPIIGTVEGAYFDGDFTLLYGGYNYTSAKSTINDEMQKFIEHIIDPFIDHISEHLRRCYEKAVREESKNMPIQTGGITANYSTVVVGSNVDGAISTHNVIDSETEKDAIELISVIKETLNNEALDDKNDSLEILQQIEEDIHAKQAPKKGFLSALKSLCSGSAAVVSLVAALIKLFTTI